MYVGIIVSVCVFVCVSMCARASVPYPHMQIFRAQACQCYQLYRGTKPAAFINASKKRQYLHFYSYVRANGIIIKEKYHVVLLIGFMKIYIFIHVFGRLHTHTHMCVSGYLSVYGGACVY